MAAPKLLSFFESVRLDCLCCRQPDAALAILVVDGGHGGLLAEEEGEIRPGLFFQVIDDGCLSGNVEIHAAPDKAVLLPAVIPVALAGIKGQGRQRRGAQVAFLFVVEVRAELGEPKEQGDRREEEQRQAVEQQELGSEFHSCSFVITETPVSVTAPVPVYSPFRARTARMRPSCPIFSGFCCMVA